MKKTTLYFEEEALLSLKELARTQGRGQSSLIREAVGDYLARHERPAPRGIGGYRSGRDDISERAEELLDERPRPGS